MQPRQFAQVLLLPLLIGDYLEDRFTKFYAIL